MKYFLIAGEASGDLHGASLIKALRQQDDQAQFALLGGDMMAAAAGVVPVVHYSQMAYMGFVDVIKHIGPIMANMRAAKRAIDEYRPDRVILIDYPSFNLKIAKHCKKRGIEVDYYISPKVWAWKEWRVRTIRKVVDKMLAIFPFEVPFYAKHGMTARYVGNPSVGEVDALLSQAPERDAFLAANGLPDKPIIALLPGSRVSEVRNNLAIMGEALKQFPDCQGVIAGAPSLDAELYAQFTSLPVVHGQTMALLKHARAGLVTSGTATLEAALAGMPQVALYRGNGKKYTYGIMKRLLHIPYVTLPNLIADKDVIPELLQHLCTAPAAAQHLADILADTPERRQMLDGYALIRQRLGTQDAAASAAAIIISQ